MTDIIWWHFDTLVESVVLHLRGIFYPQKSLQDTSTCLCCYERSFPASSVGLREGSGRGSERTC